MYAVFTKRINHNLVNSTKTPILFPVPVQETFIHHLLTHDKQPLWQLATKSRTYQNNHSPCTSSDATFLPLHIHKSLTQFSQELNFWIVLTTRKIASNCCTVRNKDIPVRLEGDHVVGCCPVWRVCYYVKSMRGRMFCSLNSRTRKGKKQLHQGCVYVKQKNVQKI